MILKTGKGLGGPHRFDDSADKRLGEPAYIRLFPKFLHNLHQKQNDFRQNPLNYILENTAKNTFNNAKTNPSSNKKPKPKAVSGKESKNSKTSSSTRGKRQREESILSDYEHIFHFSDTK